MWKIGANVSEDPAAPILRVEDGTAGSSKMLIHSYDLVLCHILEDCSCIVHIVRASNLK